MKINSKRYAKLIDVLEFVFSDIAKNVDGEFNSINFRKNPCLRDDINTHLHYYKDCRHEDDTLVTYVVRMLLQNNEVFIWGVAMDECVNELYSNHIFKKYKV